MTTTERLYVSVREAAEILRCHPVTVRRQIAAGEIPARRVGRTWRIPTESVVPPEPHGLLRTKTGGA